MSPARGRLLALALVASAALSTFACSDDVLGSPGIPPAVRLSIGEPLQNLAGGFAVLRDPGGRRTPEDIHATEDAAWRTVRGAELGLGFSPDIYWVRLTLQNPTSERQSRILELPRTIDRADLYWLDAAGVRRHKLEGKKVPFSAREYPSRNLAFALTLEPNETRPLWLRIGGSDSLAISPLLWREAAFESDTLRKELIVAAYFGAVGAMALFNFFIWISLRDRAYLYYALFQGAVMLALGALHGDLFRYLWPESPNWASRSEIAFTCLALIAGSAFARNFLSARYVTRGGDRVLVALMVLSGGGLVASLFTDHRWLQAPLQLLVVAICATVAAIGVVAWRRGSPNGPVFVAAWASLLVSAVLSAGTYGGLLTSHLLQIEMPRLGSVAEAILLSFGLARRIKLAQKEKEEVQGKLVEQERAHAQLLERRVIERTQELESALGQLQTAQDRMVKQARLAALGHLIAGVAHEVGNPLNFVVGGTAELSRRLGALKAAMAGAASERDAAVERASAGALEAAELVRNGSDRIHQLVQNLRAYTHVRTRSRELTDVAETLDGTVALIEPLTKQQGIEIARDYQPVPKVWSWRGELGQVFLNLALNSCQAMPAGGTITIHTRRAPTGGIEIEVSDTGAGVPAEHRESIFDPFFTTRLNEGTGLGLFVSQQIIQDHDGELRLVAGGPGASFVVWLPEPSS
jgi:two-component system, NtrC family, sensor kinase